MFNKLFKAGEVWLYSDASLKLTGVLLTLFTIYVLWQLYQVTRWFANGMGLY